MKMEDGRSKLGDVSRRDVLKAAVLAPLAFIPFADADATRAAHHATAALQGQAAGAQYAPKLFRMRMSGSRSRHTCRSHQSPGRMSDRGSATDAGVPEFMDFICVEYPNYQTWVRDGLRWLDGLAYDAYHKNFANCSDAQRRAMFPLARFAWPGRSGAKCAGVRVLQLDMRGISPRADSFPARLGVKVIGVHRELRRSRHGMALEAGVWITLSSARKHEQPSARHSPSSHDHEYSHALLLPLWRREPRPPPRSVPHFSECPRRSWRSNVVVALTHTRVIDGTGSAARENQTLILRDGNIAAMGMTEPS